MVYLTSVKLLVYQAEAVIDGVNPLVSLVRRLVGNVAREVHRRVADIITEQFTPSKCIEGIFTRSI